MQSSCGSGYWNTSVPPTGNDDSDAIFCDRRRAAMPPPRILHADPELPDGERQAGQDHELGEIPPGDVMILRPIDREILSPLRLGMQRLRPSGGRVICSGSRAANTHRRASCR